jgi:hypothetical protein
MIGISRQSAEKEKTGPVSSGNMEQTYCWPQFSGIQMQLKLKKI